MSNQKYTMEFKKQVVKFYLDHHTVKETLQEFHVPESTLFAWKQQYHKGLFDLSRATKAMTLNRLQSHAKKLEQILEVQRLTLCTPASSTEDKVKAIDSLKDKYSIHVLSEAFGIPRGTCYNRKRAERSKTVYEKNDDILKPIIKEIFAESEYRLGKKPIKHLLEQRGVFVSEARISRLMKEMGLIIQKPRELKAHTAPIKRKNRPNRLFGLGGITSPNMAWASDITYVRVGNEPHFVCAVIDLYSHKVIATAVSKTIDTMLSLKAFALAYQSRHTTDKLIFHTDQGVQYTALAFRTYLSELHVLQSFSAPGSPTQNPVCESFFARMKYEALYRQEYANIDELESEVEKYIDYYNNRRPHRSLNFKTPSQIEDIFYSIAS